MLYTITADEGDSLLLDTDLTGPADLADALRVAFFQGAPLGVVEACDELSDRLLNGMDLDDLPESLGLTVAPLTR